jgi:hypothetical protein
MEMPRNWDILSDLEETLEGLYEKRDHSSIRRLWNGGIDFNCPDSEFAAR